MKIQNAPQLPKNPGGSQLPGAAKPPEAPEPKDTVSFDKATNSYVYTSQYGTRREQRSSVLREALTGAALAGIPAALGVAERGMIGGATSGIENATGSFFANGLAGAGATWMNAAGGIVLGTTVGAVKGYREATEGKPKPKEGGLDIGGLPRAGLYGFFGAIGGGIGGAVLPLAGLVGGVPGAVISTVAFAGFGAYQAVKQNNRLLEEAVAHGYKPE